MSEIFFVTGTDTGIGKTSFISAALGFLNQQGFETQAIKPIASGARFDNGRYFNEDAEILLDSMSFKLPYSQVNPWVFPSAIAPHLAAAEMQETLSADAIVNRIETLIDPRADYVFIEGAGGCMIPLNQKETLLDLMQQGGWPAIVVVGMKLGCLNHALLTVEQLQRSGIRMAGWVANLLSEPMPYWQENIETLDARLGIPRIGTLYSDRRLSGLRFQTD